ncbi:MAG: hypothetical protein QNJ46_34360 [Leptolyngbyaceae cyanobacterium MO_188.B28]|nr:hypothetical protein [Leptolyngbyaceae cyanobacterium MO_188.B28]
MKTYTQQKVFLRDGNGVFQPSSKPRTYPAAAPAPSVQSVYAQFERPRKMADILVELGIPTTLA